MNKELFGIIGYSILLFASLFILWFFMLFIDMPIELAVGTMIMVWVGAVFVIAESFGSDWMGVCEMASTTGNIVAVLFPGYMRLTIHTGCGRPHKTPSTIR